MALTKVVNIATATIKRNCAECGKPVVLPYWFKGKKLKEVLLFAFCTESCKQVYVQKRRISVPHEFIDHAKDGS